MTRITSGDRIGRRGALRLGCSVVVFDPTGERILLMRRTDNGLWCLPSGGMEPGESAAEAAEREVAEETGLTVRVTNLIGEPSMRYVARWRMYVALTSLREEEVTLGELAIRLGYGSEAAFNWAFKRFMGISPGATLSIG